MEAAIEPLTDAGGADLARTLALDHCHRTVAAVTRLRTGNCHFVYAVVGDGPDIVVRIAHPKNRHLIRQAVDLNRILRPLGVPLPAILWADSDAAAPFMILERLPGRDLGDVHHLMSTMEKRCLAIRMQKIHEIVHALPRGLGYGYAATPDDPCLHASMTDLMPVQIDRIRSSTIAGGILEPSFLDPIAEAFRRHAATLAAIPPIPHLHDTTTKNVMIEHGRLTGIVDVDNLCYGDPIRTIALTRVGLIAVNQSLEYTEFWAAAAGLDAERMRLLALYAAESAACILSEIGNAFNMDRPEPIDVDLMRRLLGFIADNLDHVDPGAGRGVPCLEDCLMDHECP